MESMPTLSLQNLWADLPPALTQSLVESNVTSFPQRISGPVAPVLCPELERQSTSSRGGGLVRRVEM